MTTNQVKTMAAADGPLPDPDPTTTPTFIMQSSSFFPPAPAASPLRPGLSNAATLELSFRRSMPPAFYRHYPPAPVRPDLLKGKPRLLSICKES